MATTGDGGTASEDEVRGLWGTDPRIYAQMRPDAASLAHLRSLQEALPRRPGLRLATPARLHLTLIHFGRVRDVHAVLQAAVPGLDEEVFTAALGEYLQATRAVLPARSVTFDPVGTAGFGPGGRVLVVEYRPAPELLAVHAALYAVLERFLHRCGVQDIDAFTAGDPNFRHAARLRPHITLARGWNGAPPALSPLEPVTLEPMPVLYR